LQDLYGIINFGTADELDELRRSAEPPAEPEPEVAPAAAFDGGDSDDDEEEEAVEYRPRRRAIEEVRSSAVE